MVTCFIWKWSESIVVFNHARSGTPCGVPWPRLIFTKPFRSHRSAPKQETHPARRKNPGSARAAARAPRKCANDEHTPRNIPLGTYLGSVSAGSSTGFLLRPSTALGARVRTFRSNISLDPLIVPRRATIALWTGIVFDWRHCCEPACGRHEQAVQRMEPPLTECNAPAKATTTRSSLPSPHSAA
jgi:hypothetical protein